MKKFLWCLWQSTCLHNYEADKQVDELVYRSISLIDNCPNVTVEVDEYYITIKTFSTTIMLWNANKWYAWLSSGYVNGKRYRGMRASNTAMYDLKTCLKKHGFNIYVKTPDPEKTIIFNDIKC